MDQFKSIILISSFLIPLLFSITILFVERNSFSNRIMALVLFNAFFVFFANYFYFQGLFGTYSYLHSLHITSVLWLFPLLYIYVKSIVGIKPKEDILHLIPGLVFGIISAVLFYGVLNQQERSYYLANYRTDIEFTSIKLKVILFFRMIDIVLIISQVIFYSILFIQIPSKYHTVLEREFANIEGYSISWLYYFNGAFVFVGILTILFYIFNPFKEESELLLVLFFFFISGFIWGLAIWSFRQKKPTSLQIHYNEFVGQGSYYENDEELLKKLLNYFDEEKPYLDSGLTLTDVSAEIGTNRTYLSSLINTVFEMNFNSFVNKYRVKHIYHYKEINPEASLSTLMIIGGFGSISSLKRAITKFS